MAQNITLLGASYTAVPAVTLPKTGGGTARFDDASITTATASDVASGKVFLASDGTITTGTGSGGGGTDVVTFTFEFDSSYNIVTSSCNKTFSECYDIVNEGDATALISSIWDIDLDPWTSKSSAVEVDYSNTYIKYVAFSGVVPWADITYHSNGQIDFSEPSAYSSNLVATSNGYYGMTNGGVYIDATVNVPQPTGTKTINITSNGTTTEDVTNYANVQIDVNVPSTTISPLSVTTNGTYTAPSGTAYSPVTVNVSGGSGETTLFVYQGYDEVVSASYVATDLSVKVTSSGTYKCSWMGVRNTASGTSGSQLYKNGSAVGSAHTSFSRSYYQYCEETLTLAANDTVTVYARSRNTSYYYIAANLIVKKTS